MSETGTEPAAHRHDADVDAEPGSAVAADMADERLILSQGPRGLARLFLNRLRGGELGTLPVILGLVIICTVFYLREPAFLSSRSLVTLTQFAAPTGVISLGIVLVLLLGEIDLSVGSVAGFTSAVMAVMVVKHGQSLFLAMVTALVIGLAIGLLYATLHQFVGVPRSSSRWPVCSPSRARSSMRWATPGRSCCRRTPGCGTSPATSSSVTRRPTGWSWSQWPSTSAPTSWASGGARQQG
jgi:hypothetical protein